MIKYPHTFHRKSKFSPLLAACHTNHWVLYKKLVLCRVFHMFGGLVLRGQNQRLAGREITALDDITKHSEFCIIWDH